MIRKTDSLTYASELLVEPRAHEIRQWVRRAVERFEVYVLEDCARDLFDGDSKETKKQFLYRMADRFLATEIGRDFVDQMAAESNDD